MNKLVLQLALVLLGFNAIAQNPSFQWAKTMGGGGSEFSTSIANDKYGNIFVTGMYAGGDLDPGPGTYSATPMGGWGDLFISKFDPSGNLVWAKIIGGNTDDWGYSITVDDSGYVYTSGITTYGADFDTGPGTYTVSGGDAFVSKMDNNGTLIWAKAVNGTSISYGDKSLAVDKKGNVYYSGTFLNTVDFNPGAGVFNLSSGSSSNKDIFISKLNRQGNFVWAKKYGSPTQNDKAPLLTLDSLDNLYVTGVYSYSIDCDPGPGTYTLSSASSGSGLFVSKLDSSGSFVWAKNFYSSTNGTCTGANGEVEAKSIKIDALGNIYLLGDFHNTVDFDPGPGTYTIQSSGNRAIFMMKLNNVGNFVWAKAMATWAQCNSGYSMVLDRFGYIYITGKFVTMDFDPGSGSNIILSSPSLAENALIAKYDTTGALSWAGAIGGGTAWGYGITVDAFDNVYTTGICYGTTMDFDPGAGVVNIPSNGAQDIFLQKMNACSSPMNPTNTTTPVNQNVCLNNTHTLTVTGSGTLNWYSSPSSTVVVSSGMAFSPALMSPGTYSYYVAATTCTNSISRTLIAYTVTPLPVLTIASASSICVGSSATLSVIGATNYTWSTGATSPSTSVAPGVSSIYSVTGADLNNCTNTQTVNIIVDPTCQDVWPGDVNSDGVADNLDVLELGLHYTQADAPRATTSNAWQPYFANNWTGTIANGKNLNHSDCNGDGTINDNDTLAIYNNYSLTHTFKPVQTNTVNPQLSIVPDQSAIAKGTWGTASVYLGDVTTSINNINGIAFTVDFDNTLIETNNIYIEYQNSFLDVGQNLDFRKQDFGNGKIFTASTHTISSNVSGYGKIATLHYQIKSTLTIDQVLNLGISQANQSDASGTILPLTSGTGTLLAMGASVGLQELGGNIISISPNPTNGLLTINSKAEIQKIEVISITGKVLLSETPTNVSHTLHLENFSNGIYFVNVCQNDRIVKREKIILNK
ncbi:MAG: T9SS type A sorting domain-containing protein [Bacteroidota bacterium]